MSNSDMDAKGMTQRRFSDSEYHSAQRTHHRQLLTQLFTAALPQVPQGLSALPLNYLSQSPTQMTFLEASSGPSSFNLISPIARSSVAPSSSWSERSSADTIGTPRQHSTAFTGATSLEQYQVDSMLKPEMAQFATVLPPYPHFNPGSGEDLGSWNQPWMGEAWDGYSAPQYQVSYDPSPSFAQGSYGFTDPMQATFPQNYAYLTAALNSLHSVNPRNLSFYQDVSESSLRSASPAAVSTPAESSPSSPKHPVSTKPRRFSESVTQTLGKKGRKRKLSHAADTSELTKGMDKKDRRRMQNRLAQRAFRARSKLQHNEDDPDFDMAQQQQSPDLDWGLRSIVYGQNIHPILTQT